MINLLFLAHFKLKIQLFSEFNAHCDIIVSVKSTVYQKNQDRIAVLV